MPPVFQNGIRHGQDVSVADSALNNYLDTTVAFVSPAKLPRGLHVVPNQSLAGERDSYRLGGLDTAIGADLADCLCAREVAGSCKGGGFRVCFFLLRVWGGYLYCFFF